MHAIKRYSPPLPNYLWRKTNPNIDSYPFKNGFLPKDPKANFSPGEHALGEHLFKEKGGSQYISASHRPGGAKNFDGKAYAINPEKVPSSTRIYDTPEIVADLDKLVKGRKIGAARVGMWKTAQRTIEGLATKPGQPLKGEVLFKGPVPAKALEGAGVRALKGAGRGLFFLGVAMTAYDLGKAGLESAQQKSPLPIAREGVRQGVTWGAAIGGAKIGALVGTAICPGIGTAIGSFVGGVAGGIAGYFGGSKLASLF